MVIERHQVRLAADICVFRQRDGLMEILLIKRLKPPFAEEWALPGGHLEAGENLDACAIRELHEETGLRPQSIEHFANFSDPSRDPRGRTVSAAYVAIVSDNSDQAVAGSDAKDACWFSVSSLPGLAFDHELIICRALVWQAGFNARKASI